MNIYAVLKDDHRAVLAMIRELRGHDGAGDDATVKLQRLMETLEQHTLNEETLFYGMLDDRIDDESILEAARDEHERLDALLAEMAGTAPDTPGYLGRLGDLEELLGAHVGMEEGEMFALARRVIGPDDAERIGNEMYQREQGVLGRIQEASPPV